MAKPLKRGLNALLADIEDVTEDVKTEDKIYSVAVSQIRPNPDQPRKAFKEESLQELAQSIRSNGVIQPILVRRGTEGYIIVAGERRYRASCMAGLTQVPVIIKEFDDIKIKEISLIENLQREDLNAIEEGVAIQELMTAYHLTQEEISQRLGKSRPSIANTLRLLTLSDEIRTLVVEGKLSAGHARALLPLTDEKVQYALAQKIIEENRSVRDAEKMVKEILKNGIGILKTPSPKVPFSDSAKSFAENMSRVFATKVHLSGTEQKGKISIDYKTEEERNRIFALLETIRS